MKLILVEDVDRIGSMGDIVNVKRGYARNFLFPRNLAIEMTDGNLKVLEDKKRKRGQQLIKEKASAEELAKRISGISCTISMTAGEEDKLFGSVTAEHIAKAFSSQDISVDKKQVHIAEPIKKLGVYQVEIKLHPEITVRTKVWVVRKNH
ncbi:MAG: 50S ribosomal protein L9 [Candidatus Omnitrophota bacterium]|nr:50S ribosomal protein L9 [Candidatus Omnitrophota bacterium]